MPKRPPGKGKGADIFLEEGDKPSVKKRSAPKGPGAEVFLGAEAGSEGKPPRKRPLLAPAKVAAALDRACLTLRPSRGHLDQSHLIVMLWLRVALKGVGL